MSGYEALMTAVAIGGGSVATYLNARRIHWMERAIAAEREAGK